MTTDAQTPTGPRDMVRTPELFTGPNRAAREAVVSADAATGRECEVPSLVIISGRHRGRRIPVPSTGIVLGREGRLAPFSAMILSRRAGMPRFMSPTTVPFR